MDMPMTMEDVQRLYERPAEVRSSEVSPAASLNEVLTAQRNEAARARAQAVLDTALGMGVKAGLAWQLVNINTAIERRKRDLDTAYAFRQLMIQDRVVPAIITEARDLYNQDGDYVLRLSGAYYRIEEQARFASVAPSWREYLTFPVPKIDKSPLVVSMVPRDDNERHVWKLAVEDGWKQGVEQANLMLNYGFDRLNRNFKGMILFHSLVMRGDLTMPAIASEYLNVTQTAQTMALDETLLRITTLPEFGSKKNGPRTAVVVSTSTPTPVIQVPVPPFQPQQAAIEAPVIPTQPQQAAIEAPVIPTQPQQDEVFFDD